MSRASYTEDGIIKEILDIADNGLSHNQAAQKPGIPQPTLFTWILRQDALSYAPSHSQVRAPVAALLRQRGPGKGYQCALDSQIHETSSSYQHEDRETPGVVKVQFFYPNGY
ncbi:Histone acetyltransferase GCN5 [Fusarium oxysporum f. sp. albedinis]|nr:Histone acetyltransferase GCN5 [Fusarium oxysporum f. sp. albedinis]